MAKKRVKKNPFQAGTNHMLKVAGVTCSAVIGGQPTTFKGIFDEQAQVEVDGGSEVLINETTLTVKRSIANDINRNLPLDVEVVPGESPSRYVITDIQQTGDGQFVALKLALRTDVMQPDPYDEPDID